MLHLKIKNIMKKFREDGVPFELEKALDYSIGIDGLPKSDVLRFMSENYRLIIRPSGTEPKMKIYIQVKNAKKGELPEMINKAITLIESLIL